MNTQFYFYQGGKILSPLAVCAIVMTIMYNMLLLSEIANHLQSKTEKYFKKKDVNKNAKIESYERCLSLLPESKKHKKIVFIIVQIFVFIFNYCTVIVNGSNFARFLNILIKDKVSSDLLRDDSFAQLVTFFFLLLLMVCIKSAEYLKYPSLFSTVAILVSLVTFWFMNGFQQRFHNFGNIKCFEWSNALPLISSQVYSIESVGTLLTIRQAMKNPDKITLIVKMVFFISLALFIVNGWSFQFSFDSPVEMAFYYYSSSNILVSVLKFCFYLTLPATICITMFSLFSVFESYNFFEKKLGVHANNNSELDEHLIQQSSPTQQISYLEIVKMRIVICSILFFPLLLDINEYFLILITGSLISPCLGFIFPIIAYNYCFSEKLKKNKKIKYFNYFILVVGVGFNLASFIETVS